MAPVADAAESTLAALNAQAQGTRKYRLHLLRRLKSSVAAIGIVVVGTIVVVVVAVAVVVGRERTGTLCTCDAGRGP